MTAAVYARKSTEQHGDGEDRSVARQVANARAFAAQRGLTVADEHVFVDDGVSGAAGLDKLRGKAQLLNLIEQVPPGVLIMQSNDRLSRRDGDEAFGELKAIARRGVEIWFYADRSRFEYGTFATNTLGFLRGEFAAEYRRTISAKTHEALARKAQLGYVVGGRTFGYDNVRVNGHVERRVNHAEAAIVLQIHKQYARGSGFRVIARTLNERGAPAPRRNGWDVGTVRTILGRSLYLGQIVWNQTQKGKPGEGHPRRRGRPEHVIVAAPELRIVPEVLAARVLRRRSERRKQVAKAKPVGGSNSL